MTEKVIQKMLFEKQDKEYRDFQAKLIPDENGELKTDSMIGVRTPDLRSLAKALARSFCFVESPSSFRPGIRIRRSRKDFFRPYSVRPSPYSDLRRGSRSRACRKVLPRSH